ncbi:MAG: polysaccharide pyruvyl transferase family protein [Armatimonadota bacterium]
MAGTGSGDYFLFFGNGQYANRGCEAIAKSSIRMIRKHFPGVRIYNGNERADYDQQDETEPDVTHLDCPCYNLNRRLRFTTLLFRKTGILIDPTYPSRVIRSFAPGSKAVLSMGGDLYGLSHEPEVLIQYVLAGETALKSRRPLVIWCATIGNMDADQRLKKLAMDHFRRCSLILVRDKASVDYLAANDIRDNVRLVADPAFVLEPEEPRIPLTHREPLQETIGFNLAASYGWIGKLGSYRDMIRLGADCVESIIRKTKRPVILVPHVVAFPEDTFQNDTLFLQLVREALAARGLDVPLLPSSLRSWEIKWVLGQLYAYVGSRWHSTVAALGSGTPTVSIGFSEKAPALNDLLLGHTRFVIHCSQLTSGRLQEVLEELLESRETTRRTLQEKLPYVRALAESAGEHLKNLLTG